MILRTFLLFAAWLIFNPLCAISQSAAYDTSYIESRRTDLTLRLFGGYTFAGYKLNQKGSDKASTLNYKPNNSSNIGIGFNYRFLSVSFGIVAPFVNNDNRRLGKTKAIDIQSIMYFRKVSVDVFWQFYKGYYLTNSDMLVTSPTSNNIIIREDLRTRAAGFNVLYIFNNKRFSYKAAYVQTEYQKKSAGSALAGIDVHHFSINADSAIIPSNIINLELFNHSRFNHSRVFSLAVNAGYAYTIIVQQRFFFTSALTGGIGSNVTSLTDDKIQTKDRKISWQINGVFRLATGYNSRKYFAGIQYLYSINKNATPFAGSWQEFESGSVKVTIAKRIGVKNNMIKEAYDRMQTK